MPGFGPWAAVVGSCSAPVEHLLPGSLKLSSDYGMAPRGRGIDAPLAKRNPMDRVEVSGDVEFVWTSNFLGSPAEAGQSRAHPCSSSISTPNELRTGAGRARPANQGRVPADFSEPGWRAAPASSPRAVGGLGRTTAPSFHRRWPGERPRSSRSSIFSSTPRRGPATEPPHRANSMGPMVIRSYSYTHWAW